MIQILQVVERNRAGLGKRFLNYIIDFIFSLFLVYILISVVTIAYVFVSDSDLDVVVSEMENVNPFLDRVITILLYCFIMFLTEKFSKGRSLGKLITGTQVVKTDGSALTNSDLLKRNFSRAVPFDGLSFFGNNGWHDSWSDTRVVNKKDYEFAKNTEADIGEIGKKEI